MMGGWNRILGEKESTLKPMLNSSLAFGSPGLGVACWFERKRVKPKSLAKQQSLSFQMSGLTLSSG